MCGGGFCVFDVSPSPKFHAHFTMGQFSGQAVLVDLSVKTTDNGAGPSAVLIEKSAVIGPPKPMAVKPVIMQSWRIREKKTALAARETF